MHLTNARQIDEQLSRLAAGLATRKLALMFTSAWA